jgi:hypothetical protein
MMHSMPAKNPRLTITLEPSLAAQLRRLSELTGNSQSSLVAELLSGSGPVLEKIITVLEAAKSATASMKGMIAAEIDAAQAKMEKQLGLALEGYDEFARPILDLAEDVQRRARKKSPGGGGEGASVSPRSGGAGVPEPTQKGRKRPARGSTPMSNRGVRSVDNPTKGRKGRLR